MKPVLLFWLAAGLCSCVTQEKEFVTRDYDYAISRQTGQIAPEVMDDVRAAALKGDNEASIRLHRHYEHEGNLEAAMRWLRLSVAQGNTSAMLTLAAELDSKNAHPAEIEECRCWRMIAYHLNNPSAVDRYKDQFKNQDLTQYTSLVKRR